jgi:Protein of unknown function (DUF2804)
VSSRRVPDAHPSVDAHPSDTDAHPSVPYRGTFGSPRPNALSALALPPDPMPSHDGSRPLKAWRYVGVYSPEIMLCLGVVRLGRLRQSFWAVWDRGARRLYERTLTGRREVSLWPGGGAVRSRQVTIDLRFEETPGVETVSPSGRSYAWTRKQGGVDATGSVNLPEGRRELRARAIIDDSAGFHERHTRWCWSAGVGRAADGRELAWNLVEGVHDAPQGSERTVWIGAESSEVPPCRFDPDLRGVSDLRFEPEAIRARRDNLVLIRSVYRQPFGVFSGALPGGPRLAEGYGVMESHDAWW